MDLQQHLTAITEAVKPFKNGSQITIPVGAYEDVLTLLELVKTAKQKGATPYEVERAFAGEVIGGSF